MYLYIYIYLPSISIYISTCISTSGSKTGQDLISQDLISQDLISLSQSKTGPDLSPKT